MLTATIDQSEGISVADILEQAIKKMRTRLCRPVSPPPLRVFRTSFYWTTFHHYLGAWNKLANTKTHKRLIRDLLFEDNAALVAHTEWPLQCITSCFLNAGQLFSLAVSLKTGHLIGCDRKSEIVRHCYGRLCDKIGLLCDFFRANLHCFTRFQRRKTTLILFTRQFECKGIIKHLF